MPPNPEQEEPLKKLHKIVNSFLARPDSGPFMEPVDWRALELWDYVEIIKHPMDLGTIKRKLERDQYATAAQCASDIRLVWSNCMTYNAEGSDFWLLAKAFSKRFEDRYRRIKLEYNIDEDEEELEDDDDDEEDEAVLEVEAVEERSSTPEKMVSSPTLDSRARLAANLLLLNGSEWAHVITTLERKCPQALEREQAIPEQLEILLDELDAATLSEISQYVADQAIERKRGSDNIVIEDITGRRSKKKKT